MLKYLLLFIIILPVFSYERSDAFIVSAHPGYYKVLSPTQIDKQIGLIVQNKSLVKVFGRLETSDGQILKMINVASEQTVSVNFEYNANKRYFFIPLSPAFQEVELKRGESSYEVPAQRKEK